MKRLNGIDRENYSNDLEILYPANSEGIITEGSYGASDEGSEKLLFKNILSTILNHWFLIISINLLITALAILYVAQKTDYYRAEARVQVNTEINPALTGEPGKNAVIVNNPGSDPAYFATQLQILDGSGLLRRVIKALDLENNQAFLNPQRNNRLTAWQNVKKMLGFYNPPIQIQNEDILVKKDVLSLKEDLPSDLDQEAEQLAPYVYLLKGNLDVSPVKDSRTSTKETRLIDIEYTHQDPVIAAKIANAIGDMYVLQNLERKVETNASASDFLQKRVAELQAEIRRGDERLINYTKYNQFIPTDANQNTVVQRYAALNEQLGQAVNQRIAAQAAYQAATQNELFNTTAENKDSQVNALEARLNDLRQKLAQLKTQYTDEWFEVVETKKQIEIIENQLTNFRKRASNSQIASLQEKLNEAIARENALRTEYNAQRDNVIRQKEASINYSIIQQETDTNRNLLDGLLQQSKQNEVVMSGTRNNVLVLDRAITPAYPAGPERTKTILAAFLASLGFGIGLAFMIDWLNDSIRYSDNVENLIGLPILAAIPATPLSFGKKLLPSGLSLGNNRRNKKRYYNLTAFEKPAYLESYLQLGTYLLLSTAGGPPKTILITSAEAGEGKTVTALNLASSLSRTKNKVLLIDADLRCPRVHEIKGIPNTVGLTDLLTTKDVSSEIIERTILRISGEDLYIMTSGGHTVNPGNLLSSEEMKKLLAKLSASYSHIIIDSPPGLYFADSLIVSTLVDAVVIVARDNESSKHAVLKLKKTLQNVGANVTGMVINGVPVKQSNYNNYNHYEVIQESEVSDVEVLKIT